jgi:hypothetical protein
MKLADFMKPRLLFVRETDRQFELFGLFGIGLSEN